MYERVIDRLDTIAEQLLRLSNAFISLETRMEKMEMSIAELQEAVRANTEVTGSAIQLLDTLADKIDELKADPAALEALAGEIRGNSANLAAAVAENTPAATPPSA